MARKSVGTGERAELTRDQLAKGIARFEKLRDQFLSFDVEEIQESDDPKITELETSAKLAIEKTYPRGSAQHLTTIAAATLDTGPMHLGFAVPNSGAELRESLRSSVEQSVARLTSAINDMSEDLEAVPAPEAPPVPDVPPEAAADPRSVFVVHGHDEAAQQSVARFLQSIDLNPIILNERPGKGRSIIQKFEDEANVQFAVVLVTPDDLGRAAKDKEAALRARARQNVILELGYFVGRLGRENVCVLKKADEKGDIEIPSDYIGVEYKEMDQLGAWKQNLAKELQAAGIDIDWNKVMKP